MPVFVTSVANEATLLLIASERVPTTPTSPWVDSRLLRRRAISCGTTAIFSTCSLMHVSSECMNTTCRPSWSPEVAPSFPLVDFVNLSDAPPTGSAVLPTLGSCCSFSNLVRVGRSSIKEGAGEEPCGPPGAGRSLALIVRSTSVSLGVEVVFSP